MTCGCAARSRLSSRTATACCCAPRTAAAVRARHAIVAVSPALGGRWHWTRPLPADRDQLSQRMPMGAYMKVVLAYDRDVVARRQPVGHRATPTPGPVQMVVDSGSRDARGRGCWPASSPGARSSATAGWSWARARPPCASRSPACSATPAADWTAYAECDWTTEPYSRGGPVGLMGPGNARALRPRAAPPRGPRALGRHRHRDRVERLHGRRDPGRRARSRRGARAWWPREQRCRS